MTMFFSLGDLCVNVSAPLAAYMCVCLCCIVTVPPCARSLRKGLIKERVSVSEQLMRFSPMSCEVWACVSARTCVCACVHVDLVEDVVNWLRLTFSRGIVKGTVLPHLQSAICRTRCYAHFLYYKLFWGNDESVAGRQKEKWLYLHCRNTKIAC